MKSYPQDSFPRRSWGFFSTMDLELECHLAVVRLKLINYQIELNEYEFVMQYATPEMECFDKLLSIIEGLISEIKFLETKLKEA